MLQQARPSSELYDTDDGEGKKRKAIKKVIHFAWHFMGVLYKTVIVLNGGTTVRRSAYLRSRTVTGKDDRTFLFLNNYKRKYTTHNIVVRVHNRTGTNVIKSESQVVCLDDHLPLIGP